MQDGLIVTGCSDGLVRVFDSRTGQCIKYGKHILYMCIMYYLNINYAYMYMCQLSCLGSSVGRALCLEYRVSWVRVPPEAVFSLPWVCCVALPCLFV